MIIDCPSCATQFRAPEDAVAVPGRKLRCSNCGHIWPYGVPAEPVVEVTPVPSAPPPAETFTKVLRDAIAREEAALKKSPAVPKVRGPFWHLSGYGGRGYAAAAAILFLFLLVMSALQNVVVAAVPLSRAVYDLFGVADASTPLVIDQIQVSKPEADDGKALIRIDGRIINLSETEQPIYPIRIKLVGDGDKTVASWVFKPRITLLDREQSADFFSERPVADTAGISHVELQFVVP